MRATFLLSLIGAFCGMVTFAETRLFSAAQTVNETLDGNTTVQINCPQREFVTITGNNSYTGGTEILTGGVILSHTRALGTEGTIKCASGTAIRIKVSYRDAGEDLKALLFDRIQVQQSADGEEPWVSIQVDGDGLRNDIDFTGQPYLWLGAPTDELKILQGIYEPDQNVYHFGYTLQTLATSRGLCVTNLVDASDGTSRRVVCRGESLTTLRNVAGCKYAWTGGVSIENQARCSINGPEDLGPVPETVKPDYLTLRSGGWLHVNVPNLRIPDTIGMTVDGDCVLFISGAQTAVVCTWAGPVCGSGMIELKDQSGLAFPNARNTFDGEIKVTNSHPVNFVDIILGNGENFSWNGSAILTTLPNQRVVFNNNDDRQFNCSLEGDCSIIKRGSGRMTLLKELNREGGDIHPVLLVENGALCLDAEESSPSLSGFMQLGPGTVLDLGGHPVASLPFPEGEGSVVNVGGTDPLVFAGGSDRLVVFNGTLPDRNIVLRKKKSTTPWMIGAQAKINGDITMEAGRFALEYGTHISNPITLLENADLALDGCVPDPDGLVVK